MGNPGADLGSKAKFYAVRDGSKPGVYRTWNECQQQVDGYPGASFKSFSTSTDAQNFVAGKPAPDYTKVSSRGNFYAVAVGQSPGVYTNWDAARTQVDGVSGAQHKKFTSLTEAEAFVRTSRS